MSTDRQVAVVVLIFKLRMASEFRRCLEFRRVFFQAEDGIRDYKVTGVQTCALPILSFIGGAFRRAVPTLPVIDMLPGLEVPPDVRLPRSRFGLPDDRFLFLFCFDGNSTDRKSVV